MDSFQHDGGGTGAADGTGLAGAAEGHTTAECFAAAMAAATCARLVFAGIRQRRFYVPAHPDGTRTQAERRLRTLQADGYLNSAGPEHLP